ncbi:MAG: hypothetical protein KJZ75_17720 [Hyphomonadaceae bacterium]|nr:hypothetical protein [Hyphomonadaceae bacterium]
MGRIFFCSACLDGCRRDFDPARALSCEAIEVVHALVDRRLLLIGLAGILAPGRTAFAQSLRPANQMRSIIAAATAAGYLQTKLAFDSVISPSANGATASRVIDGMVVAARALAGSNADDTRKLAAVRTVIYEAGAWNDNRPFAYDMRDPLGRNINNKLLATYVSTRLGNCVSMPVLFLIVADRLGLNVALATAPHHVFVRYTDAEGRAVNLETTSGGHPARDVWYRQNMPMTDLALSNGIYMRTLSPRESVATMALTVGEFLLGAGRYPEVIDVAEVIGEYAPRDVGPILLAAEAYGRLFAQEFENRYPTPDAIPPNLHARYRELATMNASLYAHAEALGWRPSE